ARLRSRWRNEAHGEGRLRLRVMFTRADRLIVTAEVPLIPDGIAASQLGHKRARRRSPGGTGPGTSAGHCQTLLCPLCGTVPTNAALYGGAGGMVRTTSANAGPYLLCSPEP